MKRLMGGLAVVFSLLMLLAPDAGFARTVLVVAPHPDDEALMSGGIISRARQAGDTVKVVVATNGDCKIATAGHAREIETMRAMRDVLGLGDDDVIFLGYPDCGLRQMYFSYTSPTSVFTSTAGFTQTYAYEGLGRTDFHRYAFGVPGNYNKPSMLQDVTTLFRGYRPDEIYTTSAYDDHPDHAGTYFFVVEAMLAVMREDPTFRPVLYEGIIHEPCELRCDPSYHWPNPSFTPTLNFPEPPYLYTTPLSWASRTSFEVPAEMQSLDPVSNVKYRALSQYQSQVTSWFYAFVKKDEVFWGRDLSTNLALKANARASSELRADGATAGKAIDGFVAGAPVKADGEWASAFQLAGAWIELAWSSPQTLSRIVLHDRVNANDNILGGTLSFSDGATVPVGALPTTGVGLVVDVAPRTVTSVRFTVTSAVGRIAGLAEMEVYGTDAGPSPTPTPNTAPAISAGPSASPSTITDSGTSTLTVTATDADGDLLTYTWSAAAGSITGSGPSVVFTPPAVIASTVVRIDVVVSDGRGGSAGGSVNVTVNPSDTSSNVARAATAAASTENASRGQTAAKAVDGIVSGYPVDPTKEWASVRQLAGAWISLTWSSPQAIARVVLHDRINLTDQITAGTLEFSDGSSIAVGSLPNDGSSYVLDFPARTVTSLTLRITGARGENIGLAEIEVY